MVLPLTDGLTITPEVELIEEAQLPTRTYKLDFVKGRCGGLVEGKEAMEQAAFKALNTIRFRHLIYSDDYGFENMVGHAELFVRGDLPRRIKEAILQDERFTEVENLQLDFISKEEVEVTCDLVTLYGKVQVLKEAISLV